MAALFIHYLIRSAVLDSLWYNVAMRIALRTLIGRTTGARNENKANRTEGPFVHYADRGRASDLAAFFDHPL